MSLRFGVWFCLHHQVRKHGMCQIFMARQTNIILVCGAQNQAKKEELYRDSNQLLMGGKH
jgi:hypothetical protein